MGYSQLEFFAHGIFQARLWSRLPFPTPGDLPNPGTEPTSPYVSCISRWIGGYKILQVMNKVFELEIRILELIFFFSFYFMTGATSQYHYTL